MSVIFPSFSGHFLEHVVACGSIPQDEGPAVDWPEKRTIRKYTSFEELGRIYFARFIAGWLQRGKEKRFHAHIECATESFFGGDNPRVDCTLAELHEAVDQIIPLVAGRAFEVLFDADFEISLSRIPTASIIHPLLEIETATPGLSMRMSGGRFAIDESHVRTVEWRLRGNDESVVTSMTGIMTNELDDTYVSGIVESATSVFDSLIMAGKPVRNLEPSGT